MKQLFEVASANPISPRMHSYVRNDCVPTSRASMFDFKTHEAYPTPYYMSPRIVKGHAESSDRLYRPDSAHIYYQSPSALPAQPYIESEPIYEPVPGRISSIGSFGEDFNFETFKPSPPTPARNKKDSTRRARPKKEDHDDDDDNDDYMEMSSIGHLEISSPLPSDETKGVEAESTS